MNGLPKLQGRALDLALRPVRRPAHLRGRHRQLLRAPAGVRADRRHRAARRESRPAISPLTSPSGLVYRYVLESPDRSAMELKILQDWVLEKQYESVPGVADLSSLGGETMEYQVPARSHEARRRRPLRRRRRRPRSARTTATPAADSTPRAASSTTCADSAASPRWRTSATSCSRCTTARPSS